MKVHIIVTCLSKAMLPSSVLVFKTLRKGFPNAEINLYSNNLSKDLENQLAEVAFAAECPLQIITELISHDHWVETLIHKQNEPFWICDTDCVFYDSVEDFSCPLFGGRLQPEFYDEWTQSTHVARLHPSVMFINPVELRCAIREWRAKHIPRFFPNAISNLIRQQFTMRDGKAVFWDTCAGLHHAFTGTAFDESTNAKFEHLFGGAVADAMSAECETYKELVDVHRVVCQNPDMAKGLHERQKQFYATHNGH